MLPIGMPLATALMGVCAGQEPWKHPSLTFVNILATRKVSPGVLAKTCENIFATFASEAFKERVDQTAAKVVTYFEGPNKRKRKAPAGDQDDGDDGDDDDDGDSDRPEPS